jgi:hypothetical protein
MPAALPPATAIRNAWFSAVLSALGAARAGVWLALYPRELTSGDPVSLKPLKFIISLSIDVATLAWIEVILRRVAAKDRCFAGVESHFNDATAFDRAMFTAKSRPSSSLCDCQSFCRIPLSPPYPLRTLMARRSLLRLGL